MSQAAQTFIARVPSSKDVDRALAVPCPGSADVDRIHVHVGIKQDCERGSKPVPGACGEEAIETVAAPRVRLSPWGTTYWWIASGLVWKAGRKQQSRRHPDPGRVAFVDVCFACISIGAGDANDSDFALPPLALARLRPLRFRRKGIER